MKKFLICFSIVLLLFTSCELFLVEIGGYFLISDEEIGRVPPTGETPTPPTGGNLTSPTVGTMVKITGTGSGTYRYQGTDGGNTALQEDVTVADFYLGETEVTQGQWETLMGPTWPESAPSSSNGDGNDYPAYYINWYDAIAFCNKLSFMEGLTPVYSVKVGGVEVDWENITGDLTPDGDDTDWNAVSVNLNATGYRLPTEVEWEYAAGGGKEERTIYAGTDNGTTTGDDALTKYAWYNDNNSPFGSKMVGTAGSPTLDIAKTGNKNALGLYDMSGNVREWCYDWYTENSYRVIRGGNWNSIALHCQVAYRSYDTPIIRYSNVGFRVARSVSP